MIMLGTAAALGGWLPLCKWRRRAMNSRGGLLYVHDGAGDGGVSVLPEDLAAIGMTPGVVETHSVDLEWMDDGTWSPDGQTLACNQYRVGRDDETFVGTALLSNQSGSWVATVPLEEASPEECPPWLYIWSPCGTRLGILSQWGYRYALRVMEVPQLAVALESVGAPSEALATAGALKSRMALLCAARPVVFTWMPDGRSIIACLGWKKTMMCDIDAALACGTGSAAADIGDGDVSAWCRDITNGAKPAHWNAPILVRHPRSRSPELAVFLHQHTEHGMVGDVRTMCLHPPTYQLSAEGIRVPVAIPRCIGSYGHMSESEWVASADGRWAAQSSMSGTVDIFSFVGALDGMSGAEADGRYRISPGMLDYAGLEFSRIRAAYWSPDSNRLLLYGALTKTVEVDEGVPAAVDEDDIGTADDVDTSDDDDTAADQMAAAIIEAASAEVEARLRERNWMCFAVWERQGSRSCFAHGTVHLPSDEYENVYRAWFDTHAQAGSFWSPDSTAFCYGDKDPDTIPGPEAPYVPPHHRIFVQRVPPWSLNTARSTAAAPPADAGAAVSMAHHRDLPLPQRVCYAQYATWAPR